MRNALVMHGKRSSGASAAAAVASSPRWASHALAATKAVFSVLRRRPSLSSSACARGGRWR
jgi:hypothetical protein